MSHTLELLSEAEHGTVDGYYAGCHGSTVSCGAVVSCSDVYIRYHGDWGFRKRVDAGESPADIVAGELAELEAVRARDKAANRKAKADAARADREREEKKARAAEPSVVERISADVRRLTDEGRTVRQIAAELQVSTMSVARTREALGIHGAHSRRFIDVDLVRRLNAEGLSDTAIAQRLGASNSTISAIRRNKLKLPPVAEKVAIQHAESPRAQRQRRLAGLHAEGKTDIEIAAALGITRVAAYQARERLGLPLNRQTRRGPYTPRHTPEPLDRTDQHREVKQARVEAIATHGTAEGYTAGCRGRGCPSSPTCTDAMLTAHRAARHQAGGHVDV